MSAGLDAVKAQIVREFGSPKIHLEPDSDMGGTNLYFSAERRHFKVHVTLEFEEDYGTGMRVDLSRLGATLRASEQGRATVSRNGISAE